MEHAITIGDLVGWVLVVGGTFGVLAFLFWVVFVVLNPFSSGH